MSLEMAHKVIVPQKKNYVPQFLKQRDINSYYVRLDDRTNCPITGNGIMPLTPLLKACGSIFQLFSKRKKPEDGLISLALLYYIT
jgi:hypothetical protein